MQRHRQSLSRLALMVLATVFCLTAASAALAEKQPDPVIERDVRTVLTTTDGLDVDHLEIHSVDAHVTLRGFVPSLEQKKNAERLAAGVAGVRAVKNELQVTQIEDHF